ncbi:MAG: CDP-alcohol phosphatidyltransferase family protein, partial [bacterium]
PKPLAPILGLKLIERIIIVGRNAGIDAFKIVVGYQAEKIINVLGDGKKYDTTIEYIFNPEWEKGNGVSLMAAKDAMNNQFILLMADHLFEESIIRKLLNLKLNDGECLLAIDRHLKGSHFSLDDVTKVWVEGNAVNKIGKTIRRYNALDTGFFRCSPIIFEALEHSIALGDYGLSGGNQILANMGCLKTLDITGHLWIDVDDEVAYKKAQKTLIKGLVKQTDGPIAKIINRKISSRVSTLLTNLNVSPNQMTFISFIIAVMASLSFYNGTYGWILLGGLLAQLSSILDGCDGEIARLKYQHSFFGMWLDRILDRYADGLIILGITYAIWLPTMNHFVWFLGGFALIGTFMNSYTAIAYDKLLKKDVVKNKSSFRIGRDIRLFVIFIGALCNQLLITLVILMLITNVESIRRLFVLKNVSKNYPVTGKRTYPDYIPIRGAGRLNPR